MHVNVTIHSLKMLALLTVNLVNKGPARSVLILANAKFPCTLCSRNCGGAG